MRPPFPASALARGSQVSADPVLRAPRARRLPLRRWDTPLLPVEASHWRAVEAGTSRMKRNAAFRNPGRCPGGCQGHPASPLDYVYETPVSVR